MNKVSDTDIAVDITLRKMTTVNPTSFDFDGWLYEPATNSPDQNCLEGKST